MTASVAAVALSDSGTSSITSHTCSLPSGIVSGSLVTIAWASDGVPTVTFPAGWTTIKDMATSASQAKGGFTYRKCDGSEGASITVTTSVSEQMSFIARRWIDHADPDAQPPEVSTGVAASTPNPNPDSLTPTGGAKDYAWLAVAAHDNGQTTTSSYPTNYATSQQTRGGTSTASSRVQSAVRELNAASEDPGTFTISTTRDTAAFTVAVHPAGGAAVVTPAVIPVTVALPTPAALAPSLVAPTVIAAVVSLPTPTISVGAVAAPAVIAVITTLPTPSVLAASNVTPAVIPLVVTLPTPLAGAPTIVSPAVLAVTTTLPTPSILAASKVTPGVIPLAVLLPTPTATDSASSVVTPAVIAASVSLPTPTVAISAVVTPAGIALVATLPTPGVTTPGLVTPAGISLVVTLPTPLATVGAITFWEPNPVAFVPVGPGDQPPWN